MVLPFLLSHLQLKQTLIGVQLLLHPRSRTFHSENLSYLYLFICRQPAAMFLRTEIVDISQQSGIGEGRKF